MRKRGGGVMGECWRRRTGKGGGSSVVAITDVWRGCAAVLALPCRVFLKKGGSTS